MTCRPDGIWTDNEDSMQRLRNIESRSTPQQCRLKQARKDVWRRPKHTTRTIRWKGRIDCNVRLLWEVSTEMNPQPDIKSPKQQDVRSGFGKRGLLLSAPRLLMKAVNNVCFSGRLTCGHTQLLEIRNADWTCLPFSCAWPKLTGEGILTG